MIRTQAFPSINLPNPFSQGDMLTFFNRIKASWMPYFRQAATVTGLPVQLLVAKSAVESGGKQVTTNNTYVGLMQIGKVTIADCLNYLQGNMYADGKRWKAPAQVIAKATPIVSKSFPAFGKGGKVNSDAAFALAKSNTQAGAEFNVLMGAIYLQFLCSNPKFIDGNVLRLDKVLSAYNTGPNYSFYKAPVSDTTALVNMIRATSALSSGKKKETSAHILKFCGVGGALDMLFNNKFSLA